MNKQNDQLGKLIEGEACRDAIHIAIAPVIAAGDILPGQEIGFDACGGVSHDAKPVGIADPFLDEPIHKGQKFYVLLFPNTITGITHQWQHPAFAEQEENKSSDHAESKMWLMAFAKTIEISYSELLEAAKTWIRTSEDSEWGGDHYVFRNQTPDECYQQLEEMWKHLKNINEFEVPLRVMEDHIFTCSC